PRPLLVLRFSATEAAATEFYTLSLHDALPISLAATIAVAASAQRLLLLGDPQQLPQVSQGIHPAPVDGSALGHVGAGRDVLPDEDRKSTRLNSSHVKISYAVFCLKKKTHDTSH